MANRNQDNQSGRRSSGYRSWEDDDDRRYGDYANTDEGDSSVRGGSYDQGRVQFGRRDTSEQSGSTGRYAGYGDFGQGDYSQGRSRYSGQDRYGMTGYGGHGGQGNYGQGNYGQSDYGYGRSGQSNYGSGRSGSDYGYGRSGSSGTGDRGWTEPYGEGQQYGNERGWQTTGQGQHRGKGPKGFQRSDERLREMICERLYEDPDIDASEVTVSCQDGKITLEGTVDSRRTKNAIEDVAEQLGVNDVQNNLRVQRPGRDTENTGRSPGKSSLGSDESETSKQRKN